MRFHVIVPMYNAGPWIEQNVKVLKAQSFADFRCLLIDDLSTDDTIERARRSIDGDARFALLVNEVKRYSIGNVCAGIACSQPADEDVIVLLDADDELAHADVLRHVFDTYQREDCWMTYGSLRDRDASVRDKACAPYPDLVLKLRLSRWVRWRATHLKTFKFHAWRHIDPSAFAVTDAEVARETRRALLTGRLGTWREWRRIRAADLVDASGRYVRRCVDKAITYPLLDLCGTRSRFIGEVLYLYNDYEKDRLHGSGRTADKYGQRMLRAILRHKPRHPALARHTASIKTRYSTRG